MASTKQTQRHTTMKTKLINYGEGIYELDILNTNESYMIEIDGTNNEYDVTLLVDDEASDFIGSFESRDEAIEAIQTSYL